MKGKKIKFIHQLQSSDCGAACLTMIFNYHGENVLIEEIKSFFEFTRVGISLNDLKEVAKKRNYDCHLLKLSISDLEEFDVPLILHWKQNHFVIIEKIENTSRGREFILVDPAYGKIKVNEQDFRSEWIGKNTEKGIAVYLIPAKNTINNNSKQRISLKNRKGIDSSFVDALKYLQKRKWKYCFSIFLVGIGLLINWVIPLFFQKIVDEGIIKKNLEYVYILLGAQVILFISSFLSDIFSQVILTRMNFNMSIVLKEKLLYKIMRLPISFFDSRINTEILQRISDQGVIQNFLTWKGIEFIINVLNVIIFGGILFFFSRIIFVIYFFLTVVSVVWIMFFLEKRKNLEYSIFLRKTYYNNSVYEFIMNMSEIKINNAQRFIINKIVGIQEKINKIEVDSLFLNIYQLMGVGFLSKLKEIITIGICAFLIISENMTLGSILSISYIIGQLSSPVKNLVNFVRDLQDIDIATKRIGDVYNHKDEDEGRRDIINSEINKICIDNVSFKYGGSFSPYVLKNISLNISKNTVTAIVGASGSGKTTLMKLLLSYYEPTEGHIYINNYNLSRVNPDQWRKSCGIVLQDGKIFSGSVLENIIFSDEEKQDERRLENAINIACVDEFVKDLPMGYYTNIGNIGIQLSGGQKQRILISRAVYKDSDVLFLDEATSALDAENEKKIHDNLQDFFHGKTVVIIAHRLSTVKNADNIIVLKKGEIVEQGNHKDLVDKKGEYYNLIKNQLELGN